MFLFFSSFVIDTDDNLPVQNEEKQICNAKKDTMLNVLEALEDGRDYNSIPFWRENEYGSGGLSFTIPDFDFDFDFDFGFPELNFDKELLKDLEKRMEILNEKMEDKFNEMQEKIVLIDNKTVLS